MSDTAISLTCQECGATALRGFQMLHDSRCSQEPVATGLSVGGAGAIDRESDLITIELTRDLIERSQQPVSTACSFDELRAKVKDRREAERELHAILRAALKGNP